MSRDLYILSILHLEFLRDNDLRGNEVMGNLNVVNETRELSKPSKLFNRSGKILIVDDDIDAALLVQSIFTNLGCTTICSLTSAEAKKSIFSLNADIIILDWMLDHNIEASSLINQCSSTFKKFDHGQSRWKPKIVTYSSLDVSQISVLENPFFEHLDHWQKPLKHYDLLSRILSLLNTTGY